MPRLSCYMLLCRLLPERVRLPQYLPGQIDYPTFDDVVGSYGARFGLSADEARKRLEFAEKLESALHRPQQHAYYEEADFARQTSVLAHAISEGHTFKDGNKRLAYVVTRAFILGHGFRLAVSSDRFTAWMIMLSAPEEFETRERWTIDDFEPRLRKALILSVGGLLHGLLHRSYRDDHADRPSEDSTS